MIGIFVVFLIVMIVLSLLLLWRSEGSGKTVIILALIIFAASFVSIMLLASIVSFSHVDIVVSPDTDSVFYLASTTSPRDNPNIVMLGIQTLDTKTNTTANAIDFYETRSERIAPQVKAGDFIKISAKGEITKWGNPFGNQSAR